MILKDKFNLTATGWQFYDKIIVRKNQSDASDQFKKEEHKCQKKNNKMISEITELVTKVKNELANEINKSIVFVYWKNYCIQ